MHDLVLRTSVILAVAWVATRLMPRATAATRHLIWRGAITAVLVAPLVSPLAPRFEIFLPVVERVATAPQPAEVPTNSESTASDDLSRAPQTKPISSIEVLWMLSILAWPTGAVLALLWFSIGWFASLVSVMRAHSSPSTWRLELNALRERLRIPHEVELRISSNATSPAVLGLWRPTILLPSTARGWDADRRRAVLLHELAHIDRGDLRVQALAQAACALYWFNPLIWIAVAQLRSECEKACDDAVLRNGAMPSAYAAHLLDIARELSPSLRPSHALAMARPSQLEGRLLAVLAAKQARIPWRGSRWTVATAAVVATVAVLGASPSDGQQALTIDAAAPVRRITVAPLQSPNLGEPFAAAGGFGSVSRRVG